MSATTCDRSVAHFSGQKKHKRPGLDLFWYIVLWPSRVAAARRTMRHLAAMSDYELRDIGLGRYDVLNAASGRLDEDPTIRLAGEMQERRKAPRGNLGRV
ncbi:DUF1127 domain-containing protein [Methylovirgula sp. 4M-Z18]|uniref:DUF1127 domain-containing protein n=1 Tax=Methylovirgula sp. 4M-Z18 TaxID=2293567 RepID=UPI001314E4A3|nr:DUF1127 domain-containing protein [Methylovirgula sp. 4M-Z18]